jgi:hypothetical protein
MTHVTVKFLYEGLAGEAIDLVAQGAGIPGTGELCVC